MPSHGGTAARAPSSGAPEAWSSVRDTDLSADTRKRLSLLAAIMGSFVAFLDATVVNVALPAIERDLGGGLAGQQWVVNAYLLVLGSLILVGGRLGDVFGERRGFSPRGAGLRRAAPPGAPGAAPPGGRPGRAPPGS